MMQIKRIVEPIPDSFVLAMLRREGLTIPDSTFRDYIGEEPVSCGQVIEVLVSGVWIRGRYELARSGRAYLVTADDDIVLGCGMVARLTIDDGGFEVFQ